MKIDLIKKIYSNYAFLENISYCLKDREGIFLQVDGSRAFRGLKISTNYHLKKNLQGFNFFKHNYNIYYSLAKLNNIPLLTLHPLKRKEQYKQYNADFKEKITHINYTIDIDIKDKKDFKTGLEDINKLYDFFKYSKIEFQIRCSGSGFHLVVKEISVKPSILDNLMNMFYELTNKLIMFLDLKNVDLSIYDYRRIWKCPFTYDFKSGNLCLPLKTNEIKNFDYNFVNPEKFLKEPFLRVNEDFKKRISYFHDGKEENFTQLLEDFLTPENDKNG